MKKKEGKIKAVVFDVGGVLQLPRNSLFGAFFRGLIFGLMTAFRKKNFTYFFMAFDFVGKSYFLSIRGKVTKPELLSELEKKFSSISPKEIEKFFFDFYRRKFYENKFLISSAKRLKKNGFKVAILSDQWHLSKGPLIPKKFYKFFNPVIVSCDVKSRKPNPKIYRLLLKKLKLPGEEVFFIDDRPWNLTPAKKLGMKTILFVNNKSVRRKLEEIIYG